MDEFIQTELRKARRQKQEFLKTRILDEGYDADAFIELLTSERAEGHDVNTWTFDELETRVIVFQRANPQPKEKLSFALEELEINDDEKSVYAQRAKVNLKRETALASQPATVQIEEVDLKEGGFFSGKTPSFTIDVKPFGRVRRLDVEFKWLSDTLETELMFIPIPPLPVIPLKSHEPRNLEATKAQLQKFLEDCLKHPEISKSLALECFLLTQSKEEFSLKAKELAKYLEKNILLTKNMLKKNFENLNKNAIAKFPTSSGVAHLKISASMKQHFGICDQQFTKYETLFEKVDRLSQEWDRDMRGLILTTERLKDAFKELQSTAIKSNAQKPFRSSFNLIEESIHSTAASFFETLAENFSESRRIFEHRVQNTFRYFKDYCTKICDSISQRNFFSNEYYKSKIALNERKAKRIASGRLELDIDPEDTTALGISVEEAIQDTEIAKKLLFHEETAKVRRYADLFAFTNSRIHSELVYFEKWLVKEMLGTLEALTLENSTVITKNHAMWADVSNNIEEITKILTLVV